MVEGGDFNIGAGACSDIAFVKVVVAERLGDGLHGLLCPHASAAFENGLGLKAAAFVVPVGKNDGDLLLGQEGAIELRKIGTLAEIGRCDRLRRRFQVLKSAIVLPKREARRRAVVIGRLNAKSRGRIKSDPIRSEIRKSRAGCGFFRREIDACRLCLS